jgi:hypothetical protein
METAQTLSAFPTPHVHQQRVEALLAQGVEAQLTSQ